MDKLNQLIDLLSKSQKIQFLILFLIMLIFVILEITVLNLIMVTLNLYSSTGETNTSIINNILKNLKII